MQHNQNSNLTVERLQQLYDYNPRQGEIRNRSNTRKVLPHPEDGSVVCYDPATKLRKKMLYRNLAYVLASGKFIPAKHKVLTLDLNDENIKFHNLKLVEQTVYWDIKTALRNLLGELKIMQHGADKHAYNVCWVTRHQHRTITTYDIGKAEALKQQKALEFSKIVNQHIRSS